MFLRFLSYVSLAGHRGASQALTQRMLTCRLVVSRAWHSPALARDEFPAEGAHEISIEVGEHFSEVEPDFSEAGANFSEVRANFSEVQADFSEVYRHPSA